VLLVEDLSAAPLASALDRSGGLLIEGARIPRTWSMRIRLLEDRVLQNVAWKVADQLGWSDTFDAEYVALTQPQAGALITLDRQLAHAVKDLVTVAPIEALS
jgi:predicted nucleic acid-binding protein